MTRQTLSDAALNDGVPDLHHNDPVAQTNTAIGALFRQAPNGRIPAGDRAVSDELLSVWRAAVKARDSEQRPEPLAA